MAHTEYCLVHGQHTLNLPEPGTEKRASVSQVGVNVALRIPKARAFIVTMAPGAQTTFTAFTAVYVVLHYNGHPDQFFPFCAFQAPLRFVVAEDVTGLTFSTNDAEGIEVTVWLECDAPQTSGSFPERGGAASL